MLGRLVLAGCCSVVWCFTPPALAPRRLVVRSESLEDSLTADVLAPLRKPVHAARQIPKSRRGVQSSAARPQSSALKKGEKGGGAKLRVIAGEARGRRLESPETLLRPMMGKVREAMFSTLLSLGVFAAPRRVNVIDGFCGSGAVGVEALSRGAAFAAFVDISRDACAIAEQNANTCGYATPDRRAAVCASAEAALRGEPPAMAGKRFDLVSLTPPYEEISYADLLETVAESSLLNDDAVVVVEYPIELGSLPPTLGANGHLVGVRNRKYGRTVLAFYACRPTGKLNFEPRPEEFNSDNW